MAAPADSMRQTPSSVAHEAKTFLDFLGRFMAVFTTASH
jgi:hypothetical protein